MSFIDSHIPRTTSKFHSEAREKLRSHPKHDTMQREVLEFLRTRKLGGLEHQNFVTKIVEGEYPLIWRGQVVSFADGIEILTVNFRTTVTIFEIKPIIDTVCGILRQVKAQLVLAQTAVPGDEHIGIIVVPASDPLLAELRAEWPHTWAWGIKFPDEKPERD